MLTLPGAPALSDFRIRKLLSAIQARVPQVRGLSTRYLHFVGLTAELSEADRRVLDALLTYGPRVQSGTAAQSSHRLIVVPRQGTISPWASKATDIAHVCGLAMVERIERGIEYAIDSPPLHADALRVVGSLLHDRMIERVVSDASQLNDLFLHEEPRSLQRIPMMQWGRAALAQANSSLGLALSDEEIDYLHQSFIKLNRDPTDVELMMFAQANSEHCRHKIFNATWNIDGQRQEKSLFAMIRNTHAKSPAGVLSAYRDNAAVIEGTRGIRWFADPATGEYRAHEEPIDILMKVETHNHPTAISPFPGAATGSGGEIRDEGATGRGAKPKAGLAGFSVSNLRIPGFEQPWEHDYGRPARIASALDIMLEGPIGAAAFNNEFGRPNIMGYFRTFELDVPHALRSSLRGYHKPIMIAGGLGNIRRDHVEKSDVPAGAKIVVLGGPSMLIGLGGGAASSVGSGASTEDLDFASVQRGNPEMQRRAQEVIDRCWALGDRNPILLVHDVGAGGLSNAIPESIDHSKRGGRVDLRKVLNDEPGMSPLELWCNESQERYVLIIAADQLDTFAAFCARERCPYAVVGETTDDGWLNVDDSKLHDSPVDVPLDVILGKPPRMHRDVSQAAPFADDFDATSIDIKDAAIRLLNFPAIADKTFLISIGDRTVGGMISRDQMVGPWQVPVSDVAVTVADYFSTAGEAMAMGERTPLALLNAPASGRMAVAEAITNIAAADVRKLSDVRLSANWMAACGEPGEDADLYATVKAVGEEFCPALGIAIPVGKDSLSMKTTWKHGAQDRRMVAPLSLIVSAFAPVGNVRRTLTPQLRTDAGDSELLFIDLGQGRDRLGGSSLAQVYGRMGSTGPDCDDANLLKRFFECIAQLRGHDLVLAYHDRSDGGLFVTLTEMAFAGHCGIDVSLATNNSAQAALFAEELGAVIQVRVSDAARVKSVIEKHGLTSITQHLGQVTHEDRVRIRVNDRIALDTTRTELHLAWSETSYRMVQLRDNPECAREQYESATDPLDPGLSVRLTFDPAEDVAAPYISKGARPKVAILREQGVNSQLEMGAAWYRAGFDAYDVHMTDLIAGRFNLEQFAAMVACGGFSYGDVLGAGEGWAKSILFNARLREMFTHFFARKDTVSLGICNGCQMMAALHELIPGTDHWPRFVRNRSEQFEARFSMVEIAASPSIFFHGMEGTRMPIAVAHGEGRAEFKSDTQLTQLQSKQLVSLTWVDNFGNVASRYPANPNGSPAGIAGVTTTDGRVMLLMPHPERSYRSVQNSWHPADWNEDSGWMRLFRNARVWVG